jgi:hypothetical protein
MIKDEMIKLGCGEFIKNLKGLDSDIWKRKIQLYKFAGVWLLFNKRRKHYRKVLKGDAVEVNMTAQTEIDKRLFRNVDKNGVLIPEIPVEDSKKAEKGERVLLYNREAFGEAIDAEIDPIRDLTWIYNNIAIRNVRPEDAPSPGAFAHLKFVQENNDNKIDFFTKVYPRIIPAKSQVENLTKFNDDNRTTFDLLDRLSRESENSTE